MALSLDPPQLVEQFQRREGLGMEARTMKEYWVDIVRREVTFERYSVCVEAESAEHAQDRVREHYMGDGDGVLTYEEECTEDHAKHLDTEESIVVEIGDAEEA
jgi:hypothetical protein